MKKLEIKHLAPYLPYGLKVRYNGIINGKELGIWQREQQALDILDEPTRPMPETKYGDRIGLIKKVEIYLKHWYIRVGNGHKVISPLSFGDDAFLILRPLSDLTKEELSKYYTQLMDSDLEATIRDTKEDPRLQSFNYTYDFLFKYQFDVFGLIEKGIAIDKNTLNK